MKFRLLPLLLLPCCAAGLAASPTAARDPPRVEVRQAHERAPAHPLLGKKQTGKASYYSHRLSGRKMADGTRLNPRSNAAASKTLPLGTTARVTNLDNGKSAVVEIRDRGPYVRGRILDVSPGTARLLGMGKEGVVRVEVEAIALPPTEGAGEAGQGRRGQ